MSKPIEKKQRDMPLEAGIQWLMWRGTQPSLSYRDFAYEDTSLSRALYKVTTDRFSLMDQFKGGQAQYALSRFDKSARRRRGIEATPVTLPAYPHHDFYVAAIKGKKKEAVANITAAIEDRPELHKILSAPNFRAVWKRAVSLDENIVGGFDMQKQYMVLFGREALEKAKALFNFPENPGRYKPRPERAPVMITNGNIGMAVVQYPQQIEKARDHLLCFKHAGRVEGRRTYVYVDPDIAAAHKDRIEALHASGVRVIVSPVRKGIINQASAVMRTVTICETEAERIGALDWLANATSEGEDVVSSLLRPYSPMPA